MRRITAVRVWHPVLPLTLASLAACGGGGGGGSDGPSDIQGTIAFVPDGSTLPILEPNDSVDEPQVIGVVRAGERLSLRDSVDPASDPLDAFRLRSRETILVRARVTASDAAVGAPELLVYDPVAMRPLDVVTDGEASFLVRGACDLVVRASGSSESSYVLEVSTLRPPAPGAALLTASGPSAGARAGIPASTLAGVPEGTLVPFDSLAPLPPLALERAPSESATYGRPKLRAMRGELLVKRAPSAALEADFETRGLAPRDAIPGDAERLVFALPPAASDEDAGRIAVALCESFAADERVEYAERNLVRHALGTPVIPNDTHFPLQWHYTLAHFPEAWAVTEGDDDIIVAVIDTGETAHPELIGRQIAGYDFISDPATAADGDGRDADPTDVGDGDLVQPSSFHGTHVAGTIGASTNNGVGVAGITWFGKIMHLRVLGKGGGSDFDIANAMRYAARLANSSNTLPAVRANVINLSLGSPGASATMQSAATAARGAGVVIFAASGNENSGAPSYPAAATGVVSVAAVGPNSTRAPYSNFGATIDIAAPGGDTSNDIDGDTYADGVLSTLMDDSTQPFTPIFAFYQGTSMACPHAAGLAALVLALDPTMTPAEVETILTTTAVDLGAPGRDDLYGHGLIHARRAVDAAVGAPPPGTPVLTLAPGAVAFGPADNTRSVGVSNGGGGLLDVTTLTPSTTDGNPWLSAAAVAIGAPVTTDTSSVTVSVNRAGLADGNYTGMVTVDSNGGAQLIQVAMTVDAAAVPPDVDIFVLAVTADTFETLAQAVVNPTTGLDYALTGLPDGEYIIAAGSDDDGDDIICGDGDTYCGLYPTVNDPQTIFVSGGTLTNVDFPVVADTPQPIGGAKRSYRLLFPHE